MAYAEISTTAFDKTLPVGAPSGPGWMQLSEEIFLCNLQPLKNGYQVYKGKRLVAGEWHDIAVKLIPYNQTNIRELQMHLKLEGDPNIIRLYDADKVHESIVPLIYIAMELCSQTLKDFIKDRKNIPLDFEQYFSFAKQIVSGIAFIHKSNIMHRDIKLDNILLSLSKDSVRVADFGLSKELKDGYSAATASYRGLGSDGYRAPELLRDKPMASFRSDSFSLGIVLAMLFSNGQHPFGPDPSRWRTNITDNTGLDLSHIVLFKEPNSHKRAQLLDLIEQCLRPNEKLRPTVSEMLHHPFFARMTDGTHEDLKKVGQMGGIASQRPFSVTTATASSNTGPGSDVESSKVKINELPIEINNDDDAGPLDHLLNAKREKIQNLEKDMGRLLTIGDLENYSRILKEVKQLHDTDDLEVALQVTEYELLSKRNDAPITKLRNFIQASGSRSSMEVREKGEKIVEQGQHVQALILFKISYDLHKDEEPYAPVTELTWINNCVNDITTAIDPLLEGGGGWPREIAKRYGVKYIEDMLYDLRAIENAPPKDKALREVRCLVNVTGMNNAAGDYSRVIKFGEEGVAMMKRQFGEDAVLYSGYAGVLNNLGNAYKKRGEVTKARDCYTAAIEVDMEALDFDTEEERQQDIKDTEQNLSGL